MGQTGLKEMKERALTKFSSVFDVDTRATVSQAIRERADSTEGAIQRLLEEAQAKATVYVPAAGQQVVATIGNACDVIARNAPVVRDKTHDMYATGRKLVTSRKSAAHKRPRLNDQQHRDIAVLVLSLIITAVRARKLLQERKNRKES